MQDPIGEREDWNRELERRRRRLTYEESVQRLRLRYLGTDSWCANENGQIPF